MRIKSSSIVHGPFLTSTSCGELLLLLHALLSIFFYTSPQRERERNGKERERKREKKMEEEEREREMEKVNKIMGVARVL